MKLSMTAAVVGSGCMGKIHAGILKNPVQNVIICSNGETGGSLEECI